MKPKFISLALLVSVAFAAAGFQTQAKPAAAATPAPCVAPTVIPHSLAASSLFNNSFAALSACSNSPKAPAATWGCATQADCTPALSYPLALSGGMTIPGSVSVSNTYGGNVAVGTYGSDNTGVLSWGNSTGSTGIQSNSSVLVNGVQATAFDLYRTFSGGSTALATMDSSGNLGLLGTIYAANSTIVGTENSNAVSTSELIAKVVPPTAGATIVEFGDSITYGWGASTCVSGGTSGSNGPNFGKSVAPSALTGTCWADKVGASFNANVINVGLPVSRLQHCATASNCASVASGIDRYTTDLIPHLSGLGNNGWVFFMYGTNDASVMSMDSNFSTSGFLADIKTIVNACEAAGIPASHVWLISTAEDIRNTGPQAFSEAYNAQTQRAAQDLGVGYVDVFSAMAFNGGAGIINASDHVHPTDTGHGVIATTIEQAGGLGHTITGSFNADGTTQLVPGTSAGLNVTSCNPYPNYALGIGGNAVIGCDPVNLLLRVPGASGNLALQSSTGSNYVVIDPTGDVEMSLGSLFSTSGVNNHFAFFASGAAQWGSKLQYDGTNYASGSFEPTGYDGWNWDTYANGTFPTAESGFTQVARLDANGNWFGNSFDITTSCAGAGYAFGIFGHPIIGCDATNLDLAPPASGGYVYLKSSTGTVQATSFSDGSFFSGANSTNTNSQALNPTLGFFSGGLNSNYWGTTLYHDGTAFSTGAIEPSGYDGWYWLSYPAGSLPSTQAGLTQVAHLDASGNFTLNGGKLTLANATANLLGFSGAGIAAPSFTTISAGEKVQLYPSESASAVDYALGINTNTLWETIPTSAASFLWYAGTTNITTLSGTGLLSTAAQVKAASVAAGTQSYVAPVYTNGGAAVATTLHSITYSCAFSAGTTCAVTLTGTSTGKFASATSYSCPSPSMGAATTYVGFTVGNQAAGSFTVYASASNSDTVYGTCTGT